MPATKTPPMIAPGVLCPKCKGPMLDERQEKRSDKSPDYTCANMLCVETKNGKTYRTAIWEQDKGNGATSGTAAPVGGKEGVGSPGADSPDPELVRAQKAKYCVAMKHSVQYVLDNILPLYEKEEIAMTGDEIYKHAYSIFRSWDDAGLIQ